MPPHPYILANWDLIFGPEFEKREREKNVASTSSSSGTNPQNSAQTKTKKEGKSGNLRKCARCHEDFYIQTFYKGGSALESFTTRCPGCTRLVNHTTPPPSPPTRRLRGMVDPNNVSRQKSSPRETGPKPNPKPKPTASSTNNEESRLQERKPEEPNLPLTPSPTTSDGSGGPFQETSHRGTLLCYGLQLIGNGAAPSATSASEREPPGKKRKRDNETMENARDLARKPIKQRWNMQSPTELKISLYPGTESYDATFDTNTTDALQKEKMAAIKRNFIRKMKLAAARKAAAEAIEAAAREEVASKDVASEELASEETDSEETDSEEDSDSEESDSEESDSDSDD